MAYQPDSDEVYFCGKCNRQLQPTSSNEKCCGYRTIIWRINRESHEAAVKRWKSVNGVY